MCLKKSRARINLISVTISILSLLIIMAYSIPVFAQSHLSIFKTDRADSIRIWKKLRRAGNLMMMEKNGADSALDLYNYTLFESRLLNYTPGIIKSLCGIAGCYFYQTEYDTALAYLNKASAYSKKLPSSTYDIIVEVHRGSIYTNMGRYETAMQHYITTLGLIKNNDKKLLGQTYYNITELLLRMNKPAQALTYINKLEEEALKTKNKYDIALVYLTKGDIYSYPGFREKHPEQSRSFLLKSLEISRKYKWTMLEEEALIIMAENAIYKKEYKAALDFTNEAEKLNSANNVIKIKILILKGRCLTGLQDFNLSSAMLLKAREAALHNDKYLLPDIYDALTKLSKKKGDFEAALAYTEQSRIIKDSLNGDRVKDSIAQLQFKYATAQKDNQIIKNALLINQQNAIIQKKNVVTYTILAASGLLIIVIFFVFRYRRRIQKHKSQIAIWRATMRGEEKERSRLARELHDNIGGSLSTIRMWLNKVSKQEITLSQNENFKEAIQLLDVSLTEVRNTAHNLMPELLLRYNLAEAVQVYCSSIQKASGINIEYHYLGHWTGLDKNLKLIIYRTIQELIQNIIKHAKASFVLVQLSHHNDIISITVEDDGIGMDVDILDKVPGMGLEGIRQSIGYLKGQFSLRSEKGKGTTIYIELYSTAQKQIKSSNSPEKINTPDINSIQDED